MGENFTYKPIDSVYKPMNSKTPGKQDAYQPRQDEPDQETVDDYRNRTPDEEL